MGTSTSAPATTSYRVERVVSAGAFSAIHAADQDIVFRVVPSKRAARAAARSLSAVTTVQFLVEHGDVRAVILGVAHRLPVSRPVTIPAALALAAAGVPAVLTTDGSDVRSEDAAP